MPKRFLERRPRASRGPSRRYVGHQNNDMAAPLFAALTSGVLRASSLWDDEGNATNEELLRVAVFSSVGIGS